MDTIFVYALIGAGCAAFLTGIAIVLVIVELRRHNDVPPLSEFDAEIWHPHDDGERK